MAARRLLIIMLLLLGISSVIAIALPDPDRDDSGTQEEAVTGSTGATGATGATGETGATGTGGSDKSDGNEALDDQVTRKTVDLDAGKRVEIRAKTGSRMILTVESEAGAEVEVEGLGLTGFADPYAPAVFDVIFPEEPGQYRIRSPDKRPAAIIKTST